MVKEYLSNSVMSVTEMTAFAKQHSHGSKVINQGKYCLKQSVNLMQIG